MALPPCQHPIQLQNLIQLQTPYPTLTLSPTFQLPTLRLALQPGPRQDLDPSPHQDLPPGPHQDRTIRSQSPRHHTIRSQDQDRTIPRTGLASKHTACPARLP